ncbi:MAG: toll/interleukin-1 receptor domain-containing protein [Chloroflexota bacterium]|nr:toll/interleukin-1 receptor domain-containing protein [Chloroflexota bacterium]
MHPYEVFISYSHKDSSFLSELQNHLVNLRKQKFISTWNDKDISPGTEWKKQIMDRLNSAQIILLLISSDFMASDFCYSVEMERAMQRHDADEARVLPIIVRPVDWKGAPFSKVQALPSEGKAVTRWPTHDDAFLDVAQRIRDAIEDLDAKGKTPNP